MVKQLKKELKNSVTTPLARKAAGWMKEQLKLSKRAGNIFRKASIGAIAQLKREKAQLEEELAEEKAYALDQLNDRAEVVAELTKRAAPEGWEIQLISIKHASIYYPTFPGQSYAWHVSLGQKGEAGTLDEAVRAVEASMAKEAAAARKRKAKRK